MFDFWGMARKELYLYSNIYDYTAAALISQMEDAAGVDILLRENTNGGDPQAAYGIIAKMLERKAAGRKTDIQVDGKAYSSGFFILPFASSVTALNVSDFILHRAAYPAKFEPSPAEAESLRKLNKDLRDALESKIDAVKFTAISGVTMDNVFDENQRIDVKLTAAQAKEIGLVDKIIDINESQIAAENRSIIFDSFIPKVDASTIKPNVENLNTNRVMDVNKIQSEFPAVHAEIANAGITAERERVKQWMVFNDVDPKGVSAGIESGKSMTASEQTDFTRKAASADALAALKKESPAATTAEGADKTEKENTIAAFEASLKNQGLTL